MNRCQLVPTGANHQSAPPGKVVPTGAAPFRGAPIGTIRQTALWHDLTRKDGATQENFVEVASRVQAMAFERFFKTRTAIEVRFAGYAYSPQDDHTSALTEIAYSEGGSTPIDWYHQHVTLKSVPLEQIEAKATERRTPTPEEALLDAIGQVSQFGGEVRVEWYGLGKTNDDYRAFMIAQGIDLAARGVFIAGSQHNDPKHGLTVMPRSWVDVSDSVPCADAGGF
jgi:hypothetical protein